MIYIVSDDSFFIYGLARSRCFQMKGKNDSFNFGGKVFFINLNLPLLLDFKPEKNDVVVLSIENDLSRYYFLNRLRTKDCKIVILTDLVISKSLSKTFMPILSKRIGIEKFVHVLKMIKNTPFKTTKKKISSKVFNIFDRQAKGLTIQDDLGLEKLTTKQIYSVTDRFCRLYGLKKTNGKKIIICRDILLTQQAE